jgi:hypothetical protein
MLSIANDLASRLHQAIILSSQEHQHSLLYYLLSHTQVLYCFVLQNILNSSSPRRETRKSKGASAVPRFADLGVIAPYEGGGAGDEAGDSLGYGQFMDVNVFSTVAWRSEEKAQNKA